MQWGSRSQSRSSSESAARDSRGPSSVRLIGAGHSKGLDRVNATPDTAFSKSGVSRWLLHVQEDKPCGGKVVCSRGLAF
jgi:hypothetical protein